MMYGMDKLSDYFDNRIDVYEDFIDEEYVQINTSDDDPYFGLDELNHYWLKPVGSMRC